MTISSTTVKNSYSGDGSTTAFSYTFKIFANSDLQVIIRSSTGAETVKTITTHYTVSGAGDANGGSVTFTSGNIPASGETVVIRRAVPQTQSIDYIANDPFPAESHEEGLDRSMMTIQQMQEELDRSIKLSRTNTITSTEFTVGATDRANKVLSFDSSGELSVTQELGTFKGNWSASTSYVVRDIVKDTSTNNIFIVNTAHTSSGSQPLTTNANSAKYDLIVDAATATTQASNASTSATAAASSATAAASSATSASTQASNASSSATAAASSATAAAASATSAANSADAFDDVYLGSKSSDPSTDNDGDALAAGMLYFNTTDDVLRVYSGSAWQNAAVDTTSFITLSGTQTLSNKTLTAPVINGATIGSTDLATASNGDINIAPNGTGKVVIKGNTNQGKIVLNCEANSHGQTIIAAPHSEGATNTLTLPSSGGDARLLSATSTATLTNKTLTSPKINEDVAVTSTASELNILDGATVVVGEINALDLGSTAIGNAIASKAVILDANKDYAGIRNISFDGTLGVAGISSFAVAANVAQSTLTSSSNSVAWDASAKPNAVHVTTENTTFAAPTNNVEGAFIALEINYNGSHTIAFNTIFEFAGSTAPTFTSTDGKTDILVFRYNGSVYQEVGRTLNLSES
tara:strand:- start:204 stop:2120 length:1917 start_codon:yes stop_codon:yes gene_type:complete